MRRKRRKYGFSFSWRRAIGLSALKRKASRKVGIPFTKQGRERKLGGCMLGLLGLGRRKRRKRKKYKHVRF